jgi:hypothetical protein
VAVLDQTIADRYALYNGDTVAVMPSFPAGSMHLSVYSPPFASSVGGMYRYSSREDDLSNCSSYGEFFEHYEFVVRDLHRLTMPGRMTAVHCTDYVARYHVWKEPLKVRNRTMTKGLAHKTIVDDSSKCSVASADYLLIFRREGDNPVPIAHPNGLLTYAGSRQPPADVLRYRGWTGNQIENKYSHWIWQQYASAFWDDIRIDRVLPFRDTRDPEDEKHVHPLQLDVIERALVMWSNPGERVFTPFMGVGSEVYGALCNDRFGVGVELKPSYYRQAVANMTYQESHGDGPDEPALFGGAAS